MRWFGLRRPTSSIWDDDDELRALKDAPDEVKETRHREWTEERKGVLDPALVTEIETASDEETEIGIADEIRKLKSADPRRWKLILASLPKENQDELREIERRYGL